MILAAHPLHGPRAVSKRWTASLRWPWPTVPLPFWPQNAARKARRARGSLSAPWSYYIPTSVLGISSQRWASCLRRRVAGASESTGSAGSASLGSG